MRAYHFTGDTLRDGRSIPAIGEWLIHDRPLVVCESGLHASEHPFDALQYAPGPMLHLVELDGEMVSQPDKHCARRRKIIASRDATDMLRAFARRCALDVIQLWDAPDIVREYLETGEETKRIAAWSAADAAGSAADAAWSAARSAAWSAAGSAANAAGSAANAKYRGWFKDMVYELFREVQP